MPIYTNPTELASLQSGKKARGRGAKEKNEAQDEQLKDTFNMVDRIRQDIDASWRVTEEWRTRAEESYGFMENDKEMIWGAADYKYLMSETPKRPMMIFNDILPIIRILSGIERQKAETFRVKPREGGDVDSAQVLTELIQYVDDENLGFYQRIRKSNDVNITGRGYIKTDISYDENVNGDIILKRRNPLTIFNDPMADEWDGSDRRWVGEGEWLTEEEAKELWPDFAEQIKVGEWLSGNTGMIPGHLIGDRHENNKLFLDSASKRVRVFDYWYKKLETVMIAVNMQTGDAAPIEDPQDFMQSYAEMDGEQQGALRFIKKKQTTIRVATIMNWLLLRDDPSPYSHRYLPITPYIGLQFYKEPWGLVEYLKDPQRLLNKGVSQAMNHLNRSANSGWKNHATEGADPEVLKKFGSVPGVVLNYVSIPPEEIHPSQLSAGHVQLTQFGKMQIQNTSLINAEVQGINEGARATSGKAIQARQRGGLVGNEDLFDNGLLGDKIVGLQIMSLIQDRFTPTRAQRIVENISLGSQVSPLTVMLEKRKREMPMIIDRALKEEYDYIIDRSGGGLTAREQQAERMANMLEQWAKIGQPPLSLILATIKLQDIPEGDKQAIMQETKMMFAQMQAAQQMAMGGMPGSNGGGMPPPGSEMPM